MNPFETTEINYEEYSGTFGLLPIPESVKLQLLGHSWIERNIIYAQRELNSNSIISNEKYFIYTGRGPSSQNLHIGHLIPFMFTKYLQDILQCQVVIQIADDEKYFFKELSRVEIEKYSSNNIQEIMRIGFNPNKTFIYSANSYKCESVEYSNLVDDILKSISVNKISKVFGFDKKSNLGMLTWPAYRMAGAFGKSYPQLGLQDKKCLVVYSIDQDPYFRLTNEIADKLHLPRVTCLISKFIPSLNGLPKMSSTGNSDQIIYT